MNSNLFNELTIETEPLKCKLRKIKETKEQSAKESFPSLYLNGKDKRRHRLLMFCSFFF